MKILIATDVHCGYGENKKYLYEDSFDTFEEVLEKANDHQCDFVLLGGDLYHENQPNRDTQLRVMRSIREFCLNGPTTQIRLSSNGGETFDHSHFKKANFEDQSYSVSIPIFTIHGNHDDLSGKGQTAVDLLHESGLVNLFGKFENVKRFEINPILIEKENENGVVEKVALYGISSQRDDRLARAFQDGNVVFNTPPDVDEWLNILVLHQNRPQRSVLRSTGSFIPTDLLPGFVDLVVWGHEHASIIQPEKIRKDDGSEFLILQPGSTVATSLCPDEALPKHCFLLDSSVSLREPHLIPIPLETPRQVYYEEHDLSSLNIPPPCEKVRLKDNMEDERWLRKRIEEILDRLEETRNSVQPELPLIRIKINYNGLWKNVPPVNVRKFGAIYADRIANHTEIIMTKTSRSQSRFAPGETILPDEKDSNVNVEELVKNHFFQAKGDNKLAVLNTDALNRALQEYGEVSTTFTQVDKRFHQALKEQIEEYSNKVLSLVNETDSLDENESYKDLEHRLGKCIHAHLDEEDNEEMDVSVLRDSSVNVDNRSQGDDTDKDYF